MTGRAKNWKAYCKTAFNALSASVEDWGDPDFFRPITRIYYINVFDCATVNHLGLMSEEALLNPKERTQDHCLSPQFIGRMIMDNPDKYLQDYYIFESLFWTACSTITVTKKENKSLSMLTENNGIEYKVFVPTNLKYKHLSINLLQKTGPRWNNAIKYDDNTIPAPADLLEYEKNFLA
tara:strand:- start:50 stop:586 length:537 start_codon:yes stop_codon:yes gene_type:complete